MLKNRSRARKILGQNALIRQKTYDWLKNLLKNGLLGLKIRQNLLPKEKKFYRSDEKAKINRTRINLFQKIAELNNKQHAFYDIHVRVEFTVNNKDGTLVECDRSWEEKRPENEESLSSQISGPLIPDQSIFSQLVNFSHLVQHLRRYDDKSRFTTISTVYHGHVDSFSKLFY